MVKRCQWGTCNSDTRYPERLEGGITFIPFPKPKRNLEKCRRWIKCCGRKHDQLNTSIVDGNYNLFVCTKHFPEGKPTEKYPDPVQAGTTVVSVTPVRRAPKRRPLSEPPLKRRKACSNIFSSSKENSADPVQEDNGCLQACSTMAVTDYTPLDVLSMAAENRSLEEKLHKTKTNLQKQLGEQLLLNEDLRRKNARLEEELKKTKQTTKPQPAFSVDAVKSSPVKDNFKYYTGFNYTTFMAIFMFLVPDENVSPITFPRTITSILDMKLKDQLLLALIKIRLNLQFKHLANLFQISAQDAGALFRQWVNYMYYRFGSVPLWPERQVLQANMPNKFKEDFPNTMIILDGTELKVEKPNSLRSQSQCYSDYKSSTTLKGLVGVDPRGSFNFISMLFSGSISDKEITKQSGLLDMLQQLLDCGRLNKGDSVMVDKGFLIDEEIQKLGLKLLRPPFAPGCGQMTSSDVALTRKIARHRVHVERAISRAKKFKIVDNKIELSLFPCINQIWFCCCFLTGFMPLLIND